MAVFTHHRATRRSRRRSVFAATVGVAAILLAACSAGAAPSDRDFTPTSDDLAPVPGWPSAIAAIGHSGLTGYNSEGTGADVRSNSWATGDNPEVDSVYLRILANNPAIEGHATNVAVDGSGVDDLLRQAEQIIEADPKPELVVIQSIDNDMLCDGTDEAHMPVYRAGLVKVMDALTAGLPDATVFFASIGGSVPMYDAAVVAVDPSHLAGEGPCETVDPQTLAVVPEKEVAMQALIDLYVHTIADVCAAYDTCLTDHNAMQGIDVVPEDLTSDLDHFVASGHAKMAAVAWTALALGP